MAFSLTYTFYLVKGMQYQLSSFRHCWIFCISTTYSIWIAPRAITNHSVKPYTFL